MLQSLCDQKLSDKSVIKKSKKVIKNQNTTVRKYNRKIVIVIERINLHKSPIES